MTEVMIRHLSNLGGLGLAWALIWMQWKGARAMASELERRNRRDQDVIVENTRAMDAVQRELAELKKGKG